MWPQGVYSWWEFTLFGIVLCCPIAVFAASDAGRTIFLAFFSACLLAVGWPLAAFTEIARRGISSIQGRLARKNSTGPAEKPRSLAVNGTDKKRRGSFGLKRATLIQMEPGSGYRSPLLLQDYDSSPNGPSSSSSIRPQTLVDLGPPLPTPPRIKRPLQQIPVSSCVLGSSQPCPFSDSSASSVASGFRETRRSSDGGPLSGRAPSDDVYAIPERVFEQATNKAFDASGALCDQAF